MSLVPESTWPTGDVPQQLHRDLMFLSFTGPDAEHPPTLQLGARPLQNRSGDNEEPLRVYAEPAGHRFCIFVAEP